jgi:hypothetical protein
MKPVTQATIRFSETLSVVLLAFVVLVVSVLPVDAQIKEARTSMELGSVTVWLGMPKQEVVRRCASAGYSAPDETNGRIFDTDDLKKVTADSKVFIVKFKNGRLSFASRDWYSSKASEFGAVIGALEQFKDTRAGCSVVHDQDKSPDAEFERVFITCGLRTVLIKVGKVYGESFADVWEQIDSGQ